MTTPHKTSHRALVPNGTEALVPNALVPRALSLTALIAVLLVVGAGPTGARVFRRWRGAARPAHTLETLGGSIAYEADVAVNNGTGRLAVYSFDKPIRAVFRDLRSVFAPETLTYNGGSMGFATLDAEGKHIRLVVIHLPDHRRTLALAVEMDAAMRHESRRPPDRHRLAELPEYPGSVPVFFARDRRGGLAMAIASVQAEPAHVQRHYQSLLTQAGWTQLAPAPETATRRDTASLVLFAQARRDNPLAQNICAVFAEPAPNTPGQTRLTLLHKQPGVPP